MMWDLSLLKSALLFASAVLISQTSASISSFSPLSSTTGPTFSIGIPSSSSISTQSPGTIYMQITAPKNYAWVAFGIGEQMRGARIFVMYKGAQSQNVTISARMGAGNVEPEWDEGLQAGVEVLEGTGIASDGSMTANLKVTSSPLNTDLTSTSSPFIAAWSTSSSAVTGTSVTASLSKHSAKKQFTFDLTNSRLTSDANPFIASSPTSPQNPTSSSHPTASESGSSSSGSDDKSSHGAVVVDVPSQTLEMYQKAHGVIMSVVILLLFPLGAIFMRIGGGMMGHASLQLGSLVALLVGFGLGIKLGNLKGLLFNTSHTILGVILVVFFLIQPVLGIYHHIQYKRYTSRTNVSHVHIWFGRGIMGLGIVNGGLGLRLAANSKVGEVVYGVVAAAVVIVYVGVVWWFRGKGSKRQDAVVEDSEEGIKLSERVS